MILDKNNVHRLSDWMTEIHGDGGVLLIDKDLEWTSFDVVAKSRGIAKIKKVGHAGTLDPLATGLLILGLGKATKRMEEFQAQSKVYTGQIKLGATTKTDDSEADEDNITAIDHLTKDDVDNALPNFIGKIEQVPPMFSAKKVKGQKLYQLARKNIEIEVKPSNVEIYSFEITKYDFPLLEFEIKCSKGTYIRALARDLGKKLEVGGYLASLRRTQIGDFNAADALTVNEFQEVVQEYRKSLEK